MPLFIQKETGSHIYSHITSMCSNGTLTPHIKNRLVSRKILNALLSKFLYR